jgi:hypothetical protein
MQHASSTPLGAVRLIRLDTAVAVAEVSGTCVVIWRAAVTKVPFEWQREGLEQIVSRHMDGAGFLCIIETSAKPPEDDELRRASSQMVMAHGSRLKCVACVIEGEGFKAAINRSALAGMVLLLRNKKTPVSVFAKVKDATEWMARYTHLPPQQYLDRVEDIRARLPPPMLKPK